MLEFNARIATGELKKIAIETPRLALVPAQGLQQLTLPTMIASLLQENKNCSFIKDAERQLFGDQLNFEWNDVRALKLLNHWKKDTLVWIIFKDNLHNFESNEETFPVRNLLRKSCQKTIHGGSHSPKLSSKHRDKMPVGIVCVSPSGSFSTRILTCIIRKKSTGKGYATEACKAILKHMLIPKTTVSLKNLFDNRNPTYPELDSIVALVGPNEPAPWKRVLEKLGMTSDGSSIIYESLTEMYSINKEEFTELWSIQ